MIVEARSTAHMLQLQHRLGYFRKRLEIESCALARPFDGVCNTDLAPNFWML